MSGTVKDGMSLILYNATKAQLRGNGFDMIPKNSGLLQQNFTVQEQPTFTYAMDKEKHHIRGNTDGLAAMEQAVYKIVFTERGEYEIYSNNYGVQLKDLFGMPKTYVIPEIKRRITEALLWDDRITSVDTWFFEIPRRGVVMASFRVVTIFGDVHMERAVNFG